MLFISISLLGRTYDLECFLVADKRFFATVFLSVISPSRESTPLGIEILGVYAFGELTRGE